MQQQVHQQVQQALSSNAASPPAAASSSSLPTQQFTVNFKPPLAPHEAWEGKVGIQINDWLESLEAQHIYYERDDKARIAATIALLKGAALKEYNIAAKSQPPATYTALEKYLRERWSFVETEFYIRKYLSALVEKGPAMATQKYIEEFQRLAHRLPGDSQSSLLYQFIKGLRPSMRVKVHEKNHKSVQEAVLHVCRMDATWFAHNGGGGNSTASSGPSLGDSTEAMDISLLGPLSEEDRAACLAALRSEGLAYSETGSVQPGGAPSLPRSSSSSSPAEHTAALAKLQQQVATLSHQLSAVSLGNRQFNNRSSNQKSGKKSDREGKPSLQEIPAELRQLRRTYGYCMKCGVVKFTKGEDGHNAGNCTHPVDKTTTPVEFRQGKPPNFQ
jgi:hypothetical protein